MREVVVGATYQNTTALPAHIWAYSNSSKGKFYMPYDMVPYGKVV